MKESFSYSELNYIEEQPGCYCWYIDWLKIRKKDFEFDENKRVELINAIFKVYAPNPIFINAQRQIYEKTQYFGETYLGTIKYGEIRQNNPESMIYKDYKVFLSFLNFVNSLIIPIYIGKSKNLNRRLKQHVDFLNNSKTYKSSTIENVDIDALKNFSDRFGNILNECAHLGLRTNMLSVQIIYLEEKLITEFESNLNYIFKPLFGLK